MSEQGKTPSIALIRSVAQHPLTIPEAIKGLQHWKSNPSTRPKIHNKQKIAVSVSDKSLQQRVIQLETQVAAIMQELAKMSNK